jgi:hypothetical protein
MVVKSLVLWSFSQTLMFDPLTMHFSISYFFFGGSDMDHV